MLPLAFLRVGYYHYSNGGLYDQAPEGNYWSSRRNGATSAHILVFGPGALTPQFSNDRGYGFAFRCLAR